MLLYAVACLAGLVVLTKAADQFVIGAARLSVALRISAVVIGAVVIGFGTSTPELLVSALAAAQGSIDISVGNIIGSNVANLTLVLGVAALITPIGIASGVLRREAPISAAAVVLFAVLVQGGLRRGEGLVLVVGLVLAIGWILRSARTGDADPLESEIEEYVEEGSSLSVGRESVRTLLGLIGTLAGAQALVYGATGIAAELGVGEGFIGLTLVALGTSLPELVTAIQAARRAEIDLIVGNLLGSNMFNSLAVGAAAGLAGPGPLVDPTLAGLATVLMVGVALGAWLFMGTGRTVVRWEGGVLLGAYIVVVPLLAI